MLESLERRYIFGILFTDVALQYILEHDEIASHEKDLLDQYFGTLYASISSSTGRSSMSTA